MKRYFSNKVLRWLLTLSVSVWMAGGCLFGCSNGVMAAEAVAESIPTVAAGDSCHAAQSHHCCAAKKVKKQDVHDLRQTGGLPSFLPAPRDLMKDCPLVFNSTAASSKSRTPVPDPARFAVAVLPSFEKQIAFADNASVVSFLPNRGPTHLRCCVFLI
jgi:hypothetical protein